MWMEVKSCRRPAARMHKVICEAPAELFSAGLSYAKGIKVEEYGGRDAIRVGSCPQCYMVLVDRRRRFELWNAPRGAEGFASVMVALGTVKRALESLGVKVYAEVPSKFRGDWVYVTVHSDSGSATVASVDYRQYRNAYGRMGGYHTTVFMYPSRLKAAGPDSWIIRIVQEFAGYDLHVSGPFRYTGPDDIVEGPHGTLVQLRPHGARR